MSDPVLVVQPGPVPVLVFDNDTDPVVVVSPAPQIAVGVIVQSPPLTRLTVNAGTSSTTFVELISDTVTLNTETRIRATTYLCARAGAGTVDGHLTAILTPTDPAGPSVQGDNASCLRAGTTSGQAASVANEWTSLSAGTYRVALAWRVSSGSIVCEPLTSPNSESAVLTIETLT